MWLSREISKARITGKVRSGAEYLQQRADGRTDLDGKATIETEDGHRIAMHIEGVATPRANEPMMDLIANVRLTTSAPKFDWVNTRQIWGQGRLAARWFR
jgi:hypothetical protein